MDFGAPPFSSVLCSLSPSSAQSEVAQSPHPAARGNVCVCECVYMCMCVGMSTTQIHHSTATANVCVCEWLFRLRSCINPSVCCLCLFILNQTEENNAPVCVLIHHFLYSTFRNQRLNV